MAAAAAVLLAAGCGTGGIERGGTPDQTAGQKLFVADCAGCHTLSEANASGQIGPNLDNAFRADKAQGFKESTIENVVLDQIRLGSGAYENGNQAGTPMPANIVKGADAKDVAAYVATVAATGPSTSTPSAPVGTNGKAIFTANCASCHTLMAAGSTGTVGPNLDQLKPADAIVVHQVTNGGGVMPAFKGKLSTAQIAAVAKFVSSSAGK